MNVWKITNLSKSRRRMLDGMDWVWFGPKESVYLERIHPSQLYVKDSEIMKVEEVSGSEVKKSKKGGQ